MEGTDVCWSLVEQVSPTSTGTKCREGLTGGIYNAVALKGCGRSHDIECLGQAGGQMRCFQVPPAGLLMGLI